MHTLNRLVLVSIIGLLAACSSTPSTGDTRYTKTRSAAASEASTATTPKSPAPVAPAAPAPSPTVVAPPPPAPTPVAVAPVEPAAPAVALPPSPVVPAETIVVLPPPAPVLAPGTMQAKRIGATVRVNWALPVSSSGYRAIEIMRNTQEQASGRARIRAMRDSVTELEDIVPDTQANYWYWLKVTHADGTVENFGPVAVAPQS